jgi:hypothetical protein
MSINKNELHEMIEQLRDADRATVYDFLQFLIERNGRGLTWEEIEKLEPDHEPLSDEEKQQLAAPREYISLDQAIDEYGL